jgi:hypothetical protein
MAVVHLGFIGFGLTAVVLLRLKTVDSIDDRERTGILSCNR